MRTDSRSASTSPFGRRLYTLCAVVLAMLGHLALIVTVAMLLLVALMHEVANALLYALAALLALFAA